MTPIKQTVIFDEGYINHIDAAVDSAGNEFVVASVQFKVGDKDHVDAIVKRKIWGSGRWEVMYRFTQAEYGKHGYCAINVVGPHVVVYLVQRQADNSTDVISYVLLNIANDPL